VELFISISIFVLGLIVGSFLNVVILRLDTGLGFGGRSKCFSCGNTLRWYELIPLFSFLVQKAKCRNCNSKISWQYPAVEFVTALLFLFVYLKVGFTLGFLALAVYFVLISSLIVISVFDIRHQQIPTIPLVIFYLAGLSLFFFGDGGNFFLRIAHGLMVASSLLLLWLVSKGRWLGFGDVLLAIGVGFWLGLSISVSAILLSFWLGAIFGVLLMIVSRKKLLKLAIPFGPFIALGALLSFLYNIDINVLMRFFTWF
jgi:prepilin signal peptidase PulO-like enzyme (type II secretory pathway)